VDVLMRENSELRREIVELKVHQFYHFDDGKLKQLIQELESLRKEVKKQQQAVTDLQLENDFLRRTNAQLKLELQKEIQTRTK
jgi:anion-transporting  ArsA/GET3 family ATPase